MVKVEESITSFEGDNNVPVADCVWIWKWSVLATLGLLFVVFMLSLVINIGFYTVGIPTPRTEISKIVNQTDEYLIVEILPTPRTEISKIVNQTDEYLIVENLPVNSEEFVEVDILKFPKGGMYPIFAVLEWLPNFMFGDDRIDLTQHNIEGEDIEIYSKDGNYGVGRYCEKKSTKGKPYGHYKCNEVTTNIVYYVTDGYITSSFDLVFTILFVTIVMLLCNVSISFIVLPAWGVVVLCSILLFDGKRICREWCQGMKEAHDNGPPV